MSGDGDRKQWCCGKAGVVTLRRVGTIVRELGEPCLYQSRIKVRKILKPDKWQASFDRDGKLLGFSKLLKLIVLGGVDPSIRADVWEFLLGCYAVSSTAEYRNRLRTARRERYEDLVRQCQIMHSSVGTGSLAYIVGSRVMDMRTISQDGLKSGTSASPHTPTKKHENSRLEVYQDWDDPGPSTPRSGSADTSFIMRSCANNVPQFDESSASTAHSTELKFLCDFDFPALPVTDLFTKSRSDGTGSGTHVGTSPGPDSGAGSTSSPSRRSGCVRPEIEISHHLLHRRSNADATAMHGGSGNAGADRVSEWLWTLHRIVVDVVRTDRHLEFYGDTKNLARMSDILAVYAWVDPGTGYCQGMSDILSPFLVLYEDNADAFWCFEMLLRRMRENFQIEGPTGVMKQLQSLWHIMEFADRDVHSHLSQIGAESLHFAFPMLLVLFRRELTFTEVLHMWEMMWAADFSEGLASRLEANCLEPLLVCLPDSEGEEADEEENDSPPPPRHAFTNGRERSASPVISPFPSNGEGPSTERRDDELPIFCVAAILIINRQKIIRDTHSIDDLIQVFNEKKLKINVRRCIRTAIRVRRKYSTRC